MMTSRAECRRAYERELPGGGFVAIEISAPDSAARDQVYEGKLLVERRSGARRGRHAPPVIAQASAATVSDVVDKLLPTARCNASIGAALLQLG